MGCPYEPSLLFSIFKSSKNGGLILDPHLSIFGVPKNAQKAVRAEISGGLGRGPKKGTPSRVPKSGILQLFITFELGPRSHKGTPFRYHFGDLFSKKNEKRGFQKSAKNPVPKKHSERVPIGTPFEDKIF